MQQQKNIIKSSGMSVKIYLSIFFFYNKFSFMLRSPEICFLSTPFITAITHVIHSFKHTNMALHSF